MQVSTEFNIKQWCTFPTSDSDTTDSLLAIRILHRYWNGSGLPPFVSVYPRLLTLSITDFEGIEAYVRRNGFNDPVLTFAIGIIALWEVYLSLVDPNKRYAWYGRPRWHSVSFVNAMWESLRDLKPDELDDLSEDDSRLVAWAEVFKLHWIVRR